MPLCEAHHALLDSASTVERWRKTYNRIRPHSALEDRAPTAFVAEWVAATMPTDQDAPELLETFT